MLLIPVRIDQSAIDGLGVFAIHPIAAGTLIWTFTPGFDLDLEPHCLDNQPAHFRQAMLHYGYIDARLNRFILCCDDYRFINHSNTPNIRIEASTNRYGMDIAARNIAAGEELTIDYGTVENQYPAR